MPPEHRYVHNRLPYDLAGQRHSDKPIQTENEQSEISPAFLAAGLMRLQSLLGDMADHIENRAMIVDEYNTCPITGAASESVVTVLPTYEYVPEKIEAVIVTGPPAATVTLILGDRQWNLVIPAAGILPIGPMAIILGRSDIRQLQSATPGIYTLELMGIADRRFDI